MAKINKAFDSANAAHSLVKAVIAGDSAIDKAKALIGKAQQSQLAGIVAALENAPSVTGETFDLHWAATVKADLLAAGRAQSSVNVITSNIKVATIAITNGILPDESDSKLLAFVARVRAQLKAAGLYAPKEAGAPKKADKGEAKPAAGLTRQQALKALAGDPESVALLDSFLQIKGWQDIVINTLQAKAAPM